MQKENKKVQLKRRRRRKSLFGYFALFVAVFFIALVGLSFLVNSYTPSADIAIENNESLTLSEPEVDIEMKSIDERLKWIQLEDEMPSVSVRDNDNSKDIVVDHKEDASKKEQIEKVEKKEAVIAKPEPPKPSMSDLVSNSESFRSMPKRVVIPPPIPSLTKVYLGGYTSVDEATTVREKISAQLPDSMPFLKNLNGVYIVQLGSFSNKEVANNFITKVRELGYNPKTMNEN